MQNKPFVTVIGVVVILVLLTGVCSAGFAAGMTFSNPANQAMARQLSLNRTKIRVGRNLWKNSLRHPEGSADSLQAFLAGLGSGQRILCTNSR